MTHPWAHARPLTPSERLAVLKDWPALDPWGFHAAGIKALADYDLCVGMSMALIWDRKRKPAARHTRPYQWCDPTGWPE